jgi:hypothetical protein
VPHREGKVHSVEGRILHRLFIETVIKLIWHMKES